MPTPDSITPNPATRSASRRVRSLRCRIFGFIPSVSIIIATAVGAAFVPSLSHAAIINVTANATDSLAVNGQCSLREAITNINKGFDYHPDCVAINVPNAYGTNDTINIPAGTYKTTIANPVGTPSWGEDLNATGDYDIQKSVSVVGAGAGITIIDGNGATIRDRVFDIDPDRAGGVVVSIYGVTITGGNCVAAGCKGGGIQKNGGSMSSRPNPLTITNSTITGNTSNSAGGGIYNDGYSYGAVDVATVTNSTISNNTAGGGYSGGGIASSFGTLIISKSTITGNTASFTGGGIYNYSTLTVDNSTISNNAASDGGGIHNDNTDNYTYGTLAITNSTISGNTAAAPNTGRGGGIKNGVTLTVTNSTISGNTASFGGGIDSSVYGAVAFTNSTISGNTALYGGAVFTVGTYGATNFAITNSTIAGNTGSSYVGGINSTYGVTLSNTIVANQTVGLDCASLGVASTGHNLESGTACALTGSGDKQKTNPLLGPLANNGGSTQTMSLQSGSPAIDAGSCVQATDQRGTARPQGAGCDIGAFEAVANQQGSSTTSTSTTTTTMTLAASTTTSSTTTASTTTTTLGGTTQDVIGGWNLLGNSSSGALNVASALGDGSRVTTVWKWIASGAKWAFYAPSLVGQALTDYATGKGYDVLTTINGGEGFWVNAKTAFTAQLPSGTAITSASFQGMAAGWNLIAIGDSKTPSAFNKSIGQSPPAAGDIPINLTTLWAWDPVQSNWYFYAPSLDKSGGLGAYITSKGYLDFGTRVLDPVTGFWVNKP